MGRSSGELWYGTAPRPRAPLSLRVRRLLEAIADEWASDEMALAVLPGTSLVQSGKRVSVGVLVVTNHRVFYRGVLRRQREHYTFGLDEIEAVGIRRSAHFGAVNVMVGNLSLIVGVADPEDCGTFQDVCLRAMAGS